MTRNANKADAETGYFLFSIDTELAWGHYDNFQPDMFPADGKQERHTINRILDLLDEFDIVATWALVGHLFYGKCEKCDLCPVLEWRGKHRSFEEIYDTNSPRWYGANIIDILVERGERHEIAFHGYTHQVFDETRMTKQNARIEIQEWIRVAKRKNIIPKTVVFPRNQVGHLDLFEEFGFLCYRGSELLPKNYYSLPIIGKALNRIDLILEIRAPQTYIVNADHNGLINLPASRSLLRKKRKANIYFNWLNLDNLHIKKNIEGIEKAAREKKVIHIYTHPYEFQVEKDFEKLRHLLSVVNEQMKKGRLQSVSMTNLAEIYLQA